MVAITTAPAVQRRLSARGRWIAILEKYAAGCTRPANDHCWMPEFETASRAEIEEIQREKLAALLLDLYRHSAFYQDELNAAKLRPSDIRSLAVRAHSRRWSAWRRGRCFKLQKHAATETIREAGKMRHWWEGPAKRPRPAVSPLSMDTFYAIQRWAR